MVRRFKTLVVTLTAIFASGAVMASVGQATVGTLTTFPAGSTVVPTGAQVGEHVVTLTDHKIGEGFATTKCKKIVLPGTTMGKEGDSSVRIHPEFSECTAFGLNATVITTGCDMVFKSGTPTAAGWHVSSDLLCSAGAVLKVVTATCEITFGSQEGLTTSEMTNAGGSGTAMDVLLHTNITGIKYNVLKDGIGCPLSGIGSFAKGDYNGTTTVQAHDAVTGLPVGVTIH